ncbi:MAG: ribonuclease E/G [Actinomycetes bacterium]
MTLDDEPTTSTTDSASEQPSGAAETVSRPRRRRAASRPAGPPQADAAAPADEVRPPATEAPATEAPATEAPAAEAEPTKRAPRKRAAKKTAAPAEEPQAGAAAEAEPPAPRKRASRKRAAAPVAEAAPEQPAVSPEPPADAETVDAEIADGTADAEPDEATTALAAATATAVLFQAPEPTTAPPRRRRAASRPAGPPQVAEEPEAEAPQPPAAVDATEATPTESGTDTDVSPGEDEGESRRRRRRRGGRGRRRKGGDDGTEAPDGEAQDGGAQDGGTQDGGAQDGEEPDESAEPARAAGTSGTAEAAASEGEAEEPDEEGGTSRRRRRRRRRGGEDGDESDSSARSRESRRAVDDVTAVKGSTRLEAKRQRRREGRETGRRRQVITEAEFLARRESVERVMVVREREGRTQIAVLEDGVLVEHYVARKAQASMIGNVYLGRVQNVLPSMEAAFVDIGKGRNAVLYAGEVNWDAAGLEGQPKRIEVALKSGDPVLVQVTKDPVGHKGARLTSQISLPGRYLVYVPRSSMTGISRKLPDTERNRLKKILKAVLPEDAGVIVRTAAEGASEEELARDVTRLQAQWEDIEKKAKAVNPPTMLYGEPDLMIKVVRDVFNEDFAKLVVAGDSAWDTVQEYVQWVAPDLAERLERWDGDQDVFAAHRVDEQIAKGLERKVWLPSGGSLVIDRTEAMTVVDVNTGKFTGSGGSLEETVTKNNLEAAEEIVRQLRLRDIGGIIVVDFIDMVLESNRDLVLRRLLECLGRDRTKHQVAEVTSLGLVQMTRKRVGQGLLEAFSEPCECCGGRGVILHDEPVEKKSGGNGADSQQQRRRGGAKDVAAATARQKSAHGSGGEHGGTPDKPAQDGEAGTAEPAPAPSEPAPSEAAPASDDVTPAAREPAPADQEDQPV